MYIYQIFSKIKPYETRNKNTLKRLVGETVLICDKGYMVGVVKISDSFFCDSFAKWEKLRNETQVFPGSKYEYKTGKWCYRLENPIKFDAPIKLTDENRRTINRSFCEII